MGLAEAVLAMADEMGRRAKEWESADTMNSYACSLRLESYAEQLRIAVKASGGGQGDGRSGGESDAALHRRMIDQAREEFRRAKGREPFEEASFKAVEVGDGQVAGTVIEVPGDMPVGAYVDIDGVFYRLSEDGKLRVYPDFNNPKSG